jgi:hypothetical protein
MFVNPVKSCTKFSLAKKVMEQVEWLNEELNKQIDLNSKLAVECEKKQNKINRYRDALIEISALDANKVQFRFLRAESIAHEALEI